MKENITRPMKGLNTDVAPQDQPEGTYRMALNGVNESERGDVGFVSNEESNVEKINFGAWIPIGKCYIGDGETALFLVHQDENASAIAVASENGTFEIKVDDSAQPAKFGFKIENQIDTTYRLRRGCEKLVYFTQKGNKPRQVNLNQLHEYDDGSGGWDIAQFNLIRDVDDMPHLNNITIGTNGSLPPGSYNIGISLLDDDLNSTEVLVVSDVIKIFNDDYSGSYPSIGGSTSVQNDYYNYGPTNKSITVDFDFLDKSYTYFRLYLISANNGSGEVSQVTYTNEIPIDTLTYELTGANTHFKATVEEVQQSKLLIQEAEHIEQVDNRLILANVTGSQRDYCALQKSASAISSLAVFKPIPLNDILQHGNPKRGTINEDNSKGYMPGEIYAFGIVYVYDDGEHSPVFHIPGRGPTNVSSNMQLDNVVQGETYIPNTCTTDVYWGDDEDGNTLEAQPVRHHRFPLRSTVNKPLITRTDTLTGSITYRNSAYVNIKGKYNFSYRNSSDYDGFIYLRVKYTTSADLVTVQEYIYAHPLPDAPQYENMEIDIYFELPDIFDAVGGYYFASDGVSLPFDDGDVDLVKPDGTTDFANDALKGLKNTLGGWTLFTGRIEEPIEKRESSWATEIMGINFSNVVLPAGVIGYYITRMERKNSDKTVLDSGIITPLMETAGNDFIAFAQLNPRNATPNTTHYALTNPEFKFKGTEHTNYSRLIIEGYYTIPEVRNYLSSRVTEDTMAGTSYDSTISKRREEDNDGYSLKTVCRFGETDYSALGTPVVHASGDNTFHLNALSSTVKNSKEIFNASSDNKIAIVTPATPINITNRIPYVQIHRDIAAPYALYRIGPYYKEHTNMLFQNSQDHFNGDTYVSSMTYTNSMYYDIRLRRRATKRGILKIILGSVLILFAVVATIVTLGLGTPATIMILSAGISGIASGIKQETIRKAYGKAYDEGLRDTIGDDDTNSQLKNVNPADDEIQWFFDTLGGVFFESTVNINHRTEPTFGPQLYQDSPAHHHAEDYQTYCLSKVSVIDTDNEGGRLYQGFATAEVYDINKDYDRFNKEKIYFPLGIEYDCCSECQEDFPHRIHWSEQSFQEELSDNFANFLANNYRDIEGETGEVTDLFRMKNNLYIHTEECLWHLPQQIQERITSDVVTFIGSGEYFSIPPRRMVDDATGNSAGNKHKWGTIKTPFGVFFPCEEQGVIYSFNGNNLTPVSSAGMFSWFKLNAKLAINDHYENTLGRENHYDNNPSSPLGSGFVSVYDSQKERILFTKRDFLFAGSVVGGNFGVDYHVIYYHGNYLLFDSYQRLIDEGIDNGYEFMGIIEGLMVFEYLNNVTGNVETLTYTPARVVREEEVYNNSWTLSYSLKNKAWTSFHSYLPKMYFNTQDKFFSWEFGQSFWEHNILGKYGEFYGRTHQFIVELISKSESTQIKTIDSIKFLTEASKYDVTNKQFKDVRFTTFNKMILNNNRQCSGELELVVKDEGNPDLYLWEQVNELPAGQIHIDRNERVWTVNDLRDIRIDYDATIFLADLPSLQNVYYMDKILNTPSLDFNKSIYELESFRDKYLAIRLIFDNFEDVKLVLNYSLEQETPSFR